ncbi:MAG: sialidase family protein, partial [Sphingomonadaceae bacterium]
MTNHTIRSLAAAMLAVSTLGALSPQAAGQVSAPVHAGPDAPLAAAHPVSHKMKAQLASSAAFDRSGVLWAVSRESETGSGHLVLQRSHDEGKSWGAKVQINSESVVASGDERPRINFGAHGEIYITYSHPLAQPYTSEVRFIHSEDGGRRFSLPVTVHQDRHIITHGFASTLVDAEGRIYITWIDKRDQQAAKDGGIAYVGAAQYYAVSSDGGRSFAGDFKIADHTCECCRSSIALNPEGHAVLMWRHVFRPNIRDHALVTLRPDGKLGEIERASFDNWAIDACPHQGPALAFGA